MTATNKNKKKYSTESSRSVDGMVCAAMLRGPRPNAHGTEGLGA